MSCNYADGLSPYEDKGKLGIPEKFEHVEKVAEKIAILAQWIQQAKHVVFHTGAGISTSAGIPDFRGPKGVWTLEKQGMKPQINISFDDATPTFTHMAIVALANKNHVQYVVSQNIDGLHLKSGLERSKLSELHGNMFIGQCNLCSRQFIRRKAVTTVGQKNLEVDCPALKGGKHSCRGKLHDTVLDWEHELPVKDLALADLHSNAADLSICLGTTLQIVPSGTLPLAAKRHGGKLVICNLQPTKHDKKADLVINTYVDDAMQLLLRHLKVTSLAYDPKCDPTRQELPDSELWHEDFTKKEWTIGQRAVSITRKRLNNSDTRIKVNKTHQENVKSSKKVKQEELATHSGEIDNLLNPDSSIKCIATNGDTKVEMFTDPVMEQKEVNKTVCNLHSTPHVSAKNDPLVENDQNPTADSSERQSQFSRTSFVPVDPHSLSDPLTTN